MRGMAREYAAGNSLGPGWRESAGIFGCPVDGSVADGAVRPGVAGTKRRQHEWESEGNYGTPPSPFHRLLAFAQRSNGRGGPRRRARATSLEAPVAPVRAYELAQGASQV